MELINSVNFSNRNNMKTNKIILITFIALGFVYACNKDIDVQPEISAYTFDNVDANGGTWDPVFLTSIDDITIASPESVTSDAYKAELAEVKNASSNLTSAQKAAIEYWGGNAIARWDQIAQAMAAKYNLPPAEDADGTYHLPNSKDPGTYPYFPFANPPYASRAFAHWSAAEFDALIVAWKKKYEFNRVAPFIADPSISTSLPKQNLPSYPSEDAVIAQISVDLLTFLFPLEADYIAQKAAEHKQSRIWAGMNTQSDITAGENLAKQVSAKFITRAKNDAMGKAISTPAITDSLANNALQKFGAKWVSLETPARPGMLPLFGRVKPWCIPSVEAVRPGPPPAKGSAEYEADVQEIKNFVDNPTTETRRIANFWADGPSTATPPGHWNEIAAELIVKYKMNPLRSARTMAYMNMSLADAGISCWDTKYYYFTPRPSTAIPGLKTLIGVPNFPGYTSGHSTFSAAAATVLGHIFPAEASKMDAIAEEASNSRIYGGIHFRHDCKIGLATGKIIASYSVAVAEKDGAEK